jgi:molybdenum cofactor biosynthesis enzyme
MTWTICDCHDFQLLLQRHTNALKTTITAQALTGREFLLAAMAVFCLGVVLVIVWHMVKHDGYRCTFEGLIRRAFLFI